MDLMAGQPGVTRLGQTLLHFLWQGMAIAAIYGLARKRAESAAANVRYLLACGAMAGMAAAAVATWVALGPVTGVASALAGPAAAPLSKSAAHSAGGALPVLGYSAAATPLLSWIVACWFAGASVLWVRLIGGWLLAVRLRSRLARPAPAAWQQTLDRLRVRMRVAGSIRLLLSPLVDAPGVVGWLRPVVLLPLGALTGFPANHVEALLLHELAHIRRFDYLVNMLQSVVEALLFYHPAVWWVSGHMRAERELCCDDAAVACTGDSVDYARALAQLSALCPPVVMAANGGSLAHRIARLIGRERPAPRNFSAPGIVAAVVLPLVAGLVLFGQTAPRPKFEAVSVKPLDVAGPMRMRPIAGGLSGTLTVKALIQRGYGVQPYQITGGPDWAQSYRYAVEAKSSGNPTRAEVGLMVQSLLEERFQLKVHRETREMPIYHLTVARGGAKLPVPRDGSCKENGDEALPPSGGRMAPPGSIPASLPRCGGLDVMLEEQGVRMSGGKVAMPEFIRTLSGVLGRPVIDQTGITGIFDVRMDFQADDNTPPLPPDVAADRSGPSIFNAIATQLGLRLEPAKGPVEVIVIDHVERPSAN